MTDTHSGSDRLAAAIAASGASHVFVIDAVLRRTLVALESPGVRRELAHAEKGAVYMADGYARVACPAPFPPHLAPSWPRRSGR
jgi:acetolactate synthase I/II/III large subunit